MVVKKTEAVEKVSAEAKSVEDVRDEASESVFALSLTAFVDDSSKVPSEIHDRDKVAVVTAAVQRGLLPTGDVTLADTKILDKRNAEFTYSVPVKPNAKR